MEHLQMRGTIGIAGFEVGWWSTPDGAEVERARTRASAASPSPWSAEARAADGTVLAHATATVRPVTGCPGGMQRRIEALLAVPEQTATVVLLHGGEPVHTREVSPAPTLRLPDDLEAHLGRNALPAGLAIEGAAPRPGAYLTTRWESEGQLLCTGVASRAGDPLEVCLRAASLPAGRSCRLRVDYFDGVRSWAVASAPFVRPPQSAVPVIEAPRPDAALTDDGLLSLTGHLDGEGDPAQLLWLLDGQVVGRGPRSGIARPAAGRHTVELQHGDARTSVEVRVKMSAPERRLAAAWQPPWRAGERHASF